jgi:hypothetical protein
VHLRRALLLFAIVLGLAAVAASVSRPGRDNTTSEPFRGVTPTTTEQQTPTVTPAPGPEPAPAPVVRRFFASEPGAQKIRAGQAATVYVEVDEPGQVEIADLGLSAAAEPLTPARFDLLTSETGRHPITFLPAADEAATVRIGTLVVVAG